MLNPTFNLLQDPLIQRDLCAQFQVNITQHQFEKSSIPYFLIHLGIEQEEHFNINGKKLKIIEHHLNVPKNKDPKTKSYYHYTMSLEELKSNKKYSVHVYFGNRDNIVVESKLFSIDTPTGKSSLSTLMNSQEQNIIYLFALSQTALIMFLRKQQKEKISILTQQVQDDENKLAALSKDLSKNKKAYLTLVEQQIKNIAHLEHIGCNTFSPSIFAYKKMISFLSKPIKKVLSSNLTNSLIEPKENHPTKEKEIEIRDVIDALVPKKKRRKKKKSPLQEGNIDAQAMIATIEENSKLITIFDNAQDITTLEHTQIKAMIDSLHECNKFTLVNESVALADILKQKTELTKRLIHFFNLCDLNLYGDLAVLATIANLLPLKDNLISFIIKNDNTVLLKHLIDADLINEATKYQCSVESDKYYTIIELCVHYNSIKCFDVLLNNGYSLGYIDDENSPLLEALENPSNHIEFIEACLALKSNAYHELSVKMRQFFKNKRSRAQDKDEVELIDIKLDLIIYIERIRKLLNENPILKCSVQMDKLNVFTSNLAMRLEKQNSPGATPFNEKLKNHIQYQKAHLMFFQELNELLLVLKNKIKFKNVIKRHPNSNDTSNIKAFCEYPFDICVHFLIEYTRIGTQTLRIAKEALSTNSILRLDNGIPVFKQTAIGRQLHSETLESQKRLEEAEHTFFAEVFEFEFKATQLAKSFGGALETNKVFAPQHLTSQFQSMAIADNQATSNNTPSNKRRRQDQ